VEEIEAKVVDVARSQTNAVTWGSITRNGGPGNAVEYGGNVYYHNSKTGETVNSLGLPNIGFKDALKLLPKLKAHTDEAGKPLITSISPGRGEDPMVVIPEMVYGLADAGAEFIEINYSCPNKVTEGGGRASIIGFDLDTMFEIDGYAAEQVDGVVILRKLPPYLEDNADLIGGVASGFESIARRNGSVILNLSNTIGGRKIYTETGQPALDVPGHIGGLSGPVTAETGRNQLHQFRSRTWATIGYVSSLGIMDGAEVYHRVHVLGADFTEGVTIFVENERRGISYGGTIDRIARQYVEAKDIAEAA
jgi:dihydroorotate dehydrogenase